jgi:hypothetical protein
MNTTHNHIISVACYVNEHDTHQNQQALHKTFDFEHFQFHRTVNSSCPDDRRGKTEAVSGTQCAVRPTFSASLAPCATNQRESHIFKFNTEGNQPVSHTSGQLGREYVTQHACFFYHLLLST